MSVVAYVSLIYNKFRLGIANKYMYDSIVIITQQFNMNTVMMHTKVIKNSKWLPLEQCRWFIDSVDWLEDFARVIM